MPFAIPLPEMRVEPVEPEFIRDIFGNEIYAGDTYYLTVTGEMFCDRDGLVQALIEDIKEMEINELKELFGIEERIYE